MVPTPVCRHHQLLYVGIINYFSACLLRLSVFCFIFGVAYTLLIYELAVKTLLSILFLFYVLGIANAKDDYSFEFGKITDHEKTMTSFEDDPEAEALYIYDFGDYSFETRARVFWMAKRYRYKIKVLDEKFIEEKEPHIIKERLWDGSRGAEIFELKEAVVYNNEGGKLIKTEHKKKDIISTRGEGYTDVELRLSNVKAGSIIEVDYTFKTMRYTSPGSWNIQLDYPVVFNRFTFTTVPYVNFMFSVNGEVNFDLATKKTLDKEPWYIDGKYAKEVMYIFEKRNIPAFPYPRFIASPTDYKYSLDLLMLSENLSLSESNDHYSRWTYLTKHIWGSNYNNFIVPQRQFINEEIKSLNLAGLSKKEQLEKIYQYFKQKYHWTSEGKQWILPDIKTFRETKSGTRKALWMYLYQLIQSSGMDVTPFVLSTRDNGIVPKDYPFIGYINYAILRVIIDGENYYLDPVDPWVGFNELPPLCQNTNAYALKKDDEEIIFLEQPEPAIMETNATFRFDRDTLYIDREIIPKGAFAYNARKNNRDGMRTYEVQEMIRADSIRLRPSGYDATEEINPFDEETREYPVDLLYRKEYKLTATIEIPEGYRLAHLPEAMHLDNEIVTFDYKATLQENRLVITSSYAMKGYYFEVEQYPLLKATMQQVATKHMEAVLLLRN